MDTAQDKNETVSGTVGQVLNMVAEQKGPNEEADEAEEANASESTVVMEPDDGSTAEQDQEQGQEPLPESLTWDVSTSPEMLVARIDELTQKVAEAEDVRLRSLAEVENIQKRFDKMRSDALRYGGVPLARDLLAVVDAIDRLEATFDDNFREKSADFVEGVELISRLLMETFERHHITVVNPQKGESLDIGRHESMLKVPDASVEPGQVVQVLEKGFLFQDRLLRPARVSIADAPPATAVSETKDDVSDDK